MAARLARVRHRGWNLAWRCQFSVAPPQPSSGWRPHPRSSHRGLEEGWRAGVLVSAGAALACSEDASRGKARMYRRGAGFEGPDPIRRIGSGPVRWVPKQIRRRTDGKLSNSEPWGPFSGPKSGRSNAGPAVGGHHHRLTSQDTTETGVVKRSPLLTTPLDDHSLAPPLKLWANMSEIHWLSRNGRAREQRRSRSWRVSHMRSFYNPAHGRIYDGRRARAPPSTDAKRASRCAGEDAPQASRADCKAEQDRRHE